MISQGEIRQIDVAGRSVTVVVVSSDSFNALYPPMVAPLVQRGLPDLPPAFVALHDADPFKAVVDMRGLTSSAGGVLGDTPAAMVIGETMHRIRAAVIDLVEG